MKRVRYLTLLCMALFVWVACKNSGPSKNDIQSMKEQAMKVATYITDNYQKGDSVYFVRTDLISDEKQIERFVVAWSELNELGYYSEQEKEEDELIREIEGYNVAFKMENKENQLTFDYNNSFDSDSHKIVETSFIRINQPQHSIDDEPIHSFKNDYLIVMWAKDKCTMQRKVGIIRFSNDQYSWELVEKN